MSQPTHVVIDPILLCIHNACSSKDAFERYARGLESWTDVVQSNAANLLVSERCVEALIASDSYPFTHSIYDAISRFEITHIAADFLDRIAQVLLEQRPWFEDAIDTEDVVTEEPGALIFPEVFLSRLQGETQNAFRHALVAAAHWDENPEREFDLFVGSAPIIDDASASIRISALIEIVSRRDRELLAYSPSKLVTDEIECIFNCQTILDDRSAIVIWNCAETPEAVCSAIDFRVKSHQKKGLNVGHRVRCVYLKHPEEVRDSLAKSEGPFLMWTIGPNFMDSIHTWNFGNVEKQAELLIDACARILLDSPKQIVKPFRVSEGSENQIVRADGATGWRTHLSKKGVGFRLMFWKLKSGVIEFANVANKGEEEIY